MIDVFYKTTNLLFEEMLPLSASEKELSLFSTFYPLPTQCAKGTHYDNRPLDFLQAISASMLITSHSYPSNLINMSV